MDSFATEALMIHFYREMLSGSPPARALHDAKRALIESQGGSGDGPARGVRRRAARGGVTGSLDPYYWSAFVLVGGR